MVLGCGLRDNTIVIFTCDNGENGKKMHASEDGPRVPFIVNCPGLIQQRGATDELMEFSDIYPTLMEFSGASVPDGYALDGQSLVPFLTGATDIHREWIISYIATARMVRTKRWLLEAVDRYTVIRRLTTVVMRTYVATTKTLLARPKHAIQRKLVTPGITLGQIYPS